MKSCSILLHIILSKENIKHTILLRTFIHYSVVSAYYTTKMHEITSNDWIFLQIQYYILSLTWSPWQASPREGFACLTRRTAFGQSMALLLQSCHCSFQGKSSTLHHPAERREKGGWLDYIRENTGNIWGKMKTYAKLRRNGDKMRVTISGEVVG